VALVLTQKRPTDGAPNPYRTRWVAAGGVLWTIEARWLDTPWTVQPDLDTLIHAGRDFRATPEQLGTERDTLHAYISSDRPHGVVVRLADARTFIAEQIARPDWPQHRDTWRQLAEARGVDLTTIPLEG
jgi:hypothetical protein